MRYVFVTLEGVLGDYIKPIRTKSTTSSLRLKTLQASLNYLVYQYSDKPAYADNCQLLWEGLSKVMEEAEKDLTPVEKKWDKFKEIVDWYVAVREQIATGARRKGVSRNGQAYYKNMFLGSNVADPEFLTNYLKYTVCVTSLDFKNPDCAKELWRGFNSMSKEELVKEAVEDRIRVSVNRRQ